MTSSSEPHDGGPPLFTVVLNTYQRAERLGAAIDGVLAQTCDDFELVVADDGSTDDTADVVRSYRDRRVRYVRQDNAGLSAARNLGAAHAAGRFVVWLDDDDEVGERWLASLAALLEDTPVDDGAGSVAVVCCGAVLLDDDGRVVEERRPADLGAVLDHCVGLFLAGSFGVRRDVLEQVGGFDDELRCSHQTELSLRLVPWCSEHDLVVRSTDATPLRLHRAAASARHRNDPDRLLRCTERILARHGDRLRREPAVFARYCAIAGVCSARLGDRGAARSWFGRAVRADPWQWRHATRLALAAVPPLADRVWRRTG